MRTGHICVSRDPIFTPTPPVASTAESADGREARFRPAINRMGDNSQPHNCNAHIDSGAMSSQCWINLIQGLSMLGIVVSFFFQCMQDTKRQRQEP